VRDVDAGIALARVVGVLLGRSRGAGERRDREKGKRGEGDERSAEHGRSFGCGDAR
jgi:hypothetical protein